MAPDKVITVRIPGHGSHKDKNYNPFRTTRQDKSILLPAEQLSFFARSGMVEPGMHQQQVMLAAAAEYLKTRIAEQEDSLAECNRKIHSFNKEIIQARSVYQNHGNERAQLCAQIDETVKSLILLVAREQNACQRAGEAAASLHEADGAISMLVPTNVYMRNLSVRKKAFKSGILHDSIGLMDWAAQHHGGIVEFIQNLSLAGVDLSSFVESLPAQPNGSPLNPAIPDISLDQWSAEASKYMVKTESQLKLVNDCIIDFEKTSRQVLDSHSEYTSIIKRASAGFGPATDIVSNYRVMKVINDRNKLEKDGPWVEQSVIFAKSQLEFAKQLKIISEAVIKFNEQMTRLLQLKQSLAALEAAPPDADSAASCRKNELDSLHARKAQLEKSISSLKTDLLDAQAALERMGDSFREKQENASRRQQRALRRAKEMEGEKAKAEAERAALLANETARLKAVIERTKPLLVDALWRKDRFKFCKPENKHVAYDEFKSKIETLADLYIQNNGRLSAHALDTAFEASNPIHWESALDKDLARLAVTADKNHRLLIYLPDETDPYILFVGNHAGFDRYIKESIRGKPKADWVPEWQAGLFGRVLRDALKAKNELEALAEI